MSNNVIIGDRISSFSLGISAGTGMEISNNISIIIAQRPKNKSSTFPLISRLNFMIFLRSSFVKFFKKIPPLNIKIIAFVLPFHFRT